MMRNWDAEQKALDQELAEARKMLDVAFRPAVPGVNQQPITDAANLKAFGEARDRHEAIKAKRTEFLIERARHERRP